MDFAYHYTPAQESFRREVAAWLETALPNGIEGVRGVGPDGQRSRDAFRRKLGARGWLVPLDSAERGGGGLSADENVVLLEELNRRDALVFLEDAALTLRAALLDWGSEAQMDRLARPLAEGQSAVWRQVSVGGRPLDPDAVGITALPDADGYILNGQASFSGTGHSPSVLWTLTLVEDQGPSLPTTASFLVSPTLDGIEIAKPRTLAGDTVGRVTFDQVWVPRSDRLGDDGALVMQAAVSRSPRADLPTKLETETDALLEYARDGESPGPSLAADPVRQRLLVEAYIASRVMRLLRMRAGGLDQSHQEGHEEAEADLWEERATRRLSQVVQRVVGVYAQLGESDPRAVAAGRFERLQRKAVAGSADRALSGQAQELIAAVLDLETPRRPPAGSPPQAGRGASGSRRQGR